jgi:hypothetical protein
VNAFDRAVIALIVVFIVGWVVMLIAYANATGM